MEIVTHIVGTVKKMQTENMEGRTEKHLLEGQNIFHLLEMVLSIKNVENVKEYFLTQLNTLTLIRMGRRDFIMLAKIVEGDTTETLWKKDGHGIYSIMPKAHLDVMD